MNILEFAINMEKEGEMFYRDLAKGNSGNALSSVFSALAEDEKHHGRIIAEFIKDDKVVLPEGEFYEPSGIFKEKFVNDIKQKPEQLDAYREALKKEQESIALYKRLIEKAGHLMEKNMFGFLIKQEESHFSIIENIIFHLEKAESWVESAEFGVREDY